MSRALGWTFARFLAVGGTVTGANYLAFTGLMRIGVHYLPAASAAWALGMLLNYGLSRTFTFARKERANPREFGTFAGGAVAQLGLGLAFYWLLIERLGCVPSVAFVVNTGTMAALSFAFQRWVVFPLRHAADHA